MEPYCYKCNAFASCNDDQCPNRNYHYTKEQKETNKRKAAEARIRAAEARIRAAEKRSLLR